MRIAVTGKSGQVVCALSEAGVKNGVDILPVGRPEADLENPDAVKKALKQLAPDLIISAAAFTAVDAAESHKEQAFKVNSDGASVVAETSAEIGVPLIHISTDYVYDGTKSEPYVETDATAPGSVYGASKLAGERAVIAAAPDNHVIVRTAWVYSAFGSNFVKTMLRVGQTRDALTVVDDQIGCPTSAHDMANGLLEISKNLLSDPKGPGRRGVYHLCGSGAASWADFAQKIFTVSRSFGGPFAEVVKIPSSEYPTPAKRPANSQLNTDKLHFDHNVRLPHWEGSAESVVKRILTEQTA